MFKTLNLARRFGHRNMNHNIRLLNAVSRRLSLTWHRTCAGMEKNRLLPYHRLFGSVGYIDDAQTVYNLRSSAVFYHSGPHSERMLKF